MSDLNNAKVDKIQSPDSIFAQELRKLKERLENDPRTIAKTLETYYEPHAGESKTYSGRKTGSDKEITGTFKQEDFSIKFLNNQVLKARITFIRVPYEDLEIRISVLNGNNEVYTFKSWKITKNSYAQQTDPGDTIFWHSYPDFNKALTTSAPKPAAVVKPAPTSKPSSTSTVTNKPATSANVPKPTPAAIKLPEAITTAYSFLDVNKFATLMDSTTTATTLLESRNLIEKYGYIWFLSYIQAKDWVITMDDADKICQWYSSFKSAVLTSYTELIKEKDIFNSAGKYGNLGQIQDPHKRVLIFSLLQYYRNHVKYSTDAVWWKDFWRTFIGLKWYRQDNRDIKVQMDCDLMSILACDICRSQWINMDLLINYDPVTNRPNHANTKIESTLIERTNTSSWGRWEISWTVVVTPYAWNSIVGRFFDTYAQWAIEEEKSNILDIQKWVIAFSLWKSIESYASLATAIHNYGIWEFNTNDYSWVSLEDYEYIAKVLLEFRVASIKRYSTDPQFKVLESKLIALIAEFKTKIDKLKKYIKSFNYTNLNSTMAKL